MRISIQQCKFIMKFLFNQNYIFESASIQLVYYIHAMNAELSFAHTVNQINHFIIISHKIQIDYLIKLDFIKVYLIDAEAIILIL